MGKYDPLYCYLKSDGRWQVELSYTEIENILSAILPNSAHKYTQWWDNNSHAQSKSWRDAGYVIKSVYLGEKVVFTKE